MRTLNRTGFTLVELIIALALGALVASAVYRAIVGSQRVTQAGAEKMDVQQNLRAGATYLGSLIRELDASEGDISVATATRMQFRSMRWVAPLCDDPVPNGPTAVLLTIRSASTFGLRGPSSVEDSALVFADGDPTTRTDDAWLAGALTGLSASACPDGAPATNLTVEITAASGGQAAVLAGVTFGAPVRGFQPEELSLFQTPDSRWWMGQRTANRLGTWTTVRPLVGPLAAAGLAFTYHDTTGAATAVLTDIASVGIALRGESQLRVRGLGGDIDYARDSILTRAALRNNARF
jgi:prepilin-type N-terminal cleavage/methylation domain-containing protein